MENFAAQLPDDVVINTATVMNDPVLFSERILKHRTWRGMRELLRGVRDYPLVAIRSGHSLSKTFSAADALLWWLAKYRNGVVLTTSPTGRQVEALLWGEVRKVLSQETRIGIDYPQPNLAKLEFSASNYAMGFSTSAEGAGVNMAGFKGADLLFIVDEAIGVEGPIWDAIEGARSSGNVHVLVLFNPLTASGKVYEFFTTDRARWKLYTFNCLRSPNLAGDEATESEIEKILDQLRALPKGLLETEHEFFKYKPWSMLASRFWVYEQLKRYGEQSPFWQSRVRGEFPEQAEDSLYPLAWLERARESSEDVISRQGVCEAGIDVAGPGRDKTAVCVRVGRRIVARHSYSGDSRGPCIAFLTPWRERLRVTSIDVGGSGYYFSKQIGEAGFRVQPVNFGAASPTKDTGDIEFQNMKSALYWRMREILELREIEGLNEEEIAQATQQRYSINTSGKVEIIKKSSCASWAFVPLMSGKQPCWRL